MKYYYYPVICWGISFINHEIRIPIKNNPYDSWIAYPAGKYHQGQGPKRLAWRFYTLEDERLEPDNTPKRKRKRIWTKQSFSGSMLIFRGVIQDYWPPGVFCPLWFLVDEIGNGSGIRILSTLNLLVVLLMEEIGQRPAMFFPTQQIDATRRINSLWTGARFLEIKSTMMAPVSNQLVVAWCWRVVVPF